jgi:hypothetical protein
MIKQYLFYVGQDVYSHELKLSRQIVVNEGVTSDEEGPAYIDHFYHMFKQQQISALLLIVLEIDTVAGIKVVTNEYMVNPLKKKIVINPRVLEKKVVTKKLSNSAMFIFDELSTPEDAT